MQHQTALRELLVRLLDWEDAHLNSRNILSEWPSELRGVKPDGCPHTAWQLLEHLRICQRDILEFSRDPSHISPDFPSGYWPPDEAPPADAAWTASIAQLQDDLEQMKQLVIDPDMDLFAAIPHGQGQTILREAVLVADHNSYHLGQLLLLRRILGDWPRRH